MGMTYAIIYMLSSIGVLATAIIAPAMGEIQAYFHDVNPTLIKFIMTISSLFVIPSSYLSISMYKKYGKRNTLLFSLTIYIVAGCLAGFLSNIYAILASRALLGIGLGILIPIGNSLPLDYFRGAELSKVVARQSACISLGNFVFILVAGWLALISWRYTFLIYGIALPIMLCILFFFPEEKYKDEDKQVNNSEISKQQNNEKLPYTVFIQATVMFCFLIAIYTYHTGLAMLMKDRGIGTAASAAYVLSTNSVASFTAAMFIRKIHAKIDKHVISMICISMSLGFYSLYSMTSLVGAFLAAICIAFAMGSVMSSNGILINRQAEMFGLSKTRTLKALSIVNTAVFLGQFASPLFFDSLPNFSSSSSGIGGSYLTLSLIFAGITPFVALACHIKLKNKIFS